MPVYDFKCLNCEKEFEERVKGIDQCDEVKCPSCGSGSWQRLLSLFSGYKISGNNGASITPKKYRGGK